MEVRNCRQCGRLYNYIGGSYKNLCPSCINKLEDKFAVVKEYIEDNKMATISEISEECEVSVKQLEQWIREERLCFTEDSPIGIACESCGATIKSGRFCDKCKSTMASQLGSMYGQKTNPNLKSNTRQTDREKARMRFLDQMNLKK